MPKQVLNGLSFPSISTLPSASSNTGAIFTSAGVLWYSNGTSWIFLSRVGKPAAIAASSAAINTTETYITPAFSLPANTLYVGAAFRIRVFGTCTSTAANVSTLTVRMGTAGTTADTSVLAATCTAATSGTSIPFSFEIIVTVRSIGAAGTAIASVQLVNSGVTGITATATVVSGTGTTATINTTGALFLGASIKSAATTTTSTINTAMVEQVV